MLHSRFPDMSVYFLKSLLGSIAYTKFIYMLLLSGPFSIPNEGSNILSCQQPISILGLDKLTVYRAIFGLDATAVMKAKTSS